MLKRFIPYFLFLIVVLSSCLRSSDNKGYSKTDSGLYYKLQFIGEGKHKPLAGDLLQLTITYKTPNDSIFFDTHSSNPTGMVILPFGRSSFIGSFEEGLGNMSEGDSVSFIVNADSLFMRFFKIPLPLFLKQGSSVKMDVKLNQILNAKQYQAELSKYKGLQEDGDLMEQRNLQLYLDTNKVQYSSLGNGMYYLPIEQGVGDPVAKGDQVKINYRGYFLNGKQFESTFERRQPLEFVFGEQGQVIKGFEKAISLMNEGEKAKFIIPSQLAFGETGSLTGIVPPNTTVIYEIELLNLTKKQ